MTQQEKTDAAFEKEFGPEAYTYRRAEKVGWDHALVYATSEHAKERAELVVVLNEVDAMLAYRSHTYEEIGLLVKALLRRIEEGS